jgi:predicted phage replisome organizer
MSDNKKYYYMRVKENFYETEDMKILQSMNNGYLYSDILMKLYLKSLKNDGRLMFKDHIPYNTQMIATITGHNVDVVEKSLGIFKELNLIDVLDNGAIYMLDIQNFIGKTSTEADRIKEYRKKIKDETRLLNGDVQMYDEGTPELEKELELEREKELDDNTISKDIVSNNKLRPVIDKWNSLGLQKLISINAGTNRYKMLNARLKEYGLDKVLDAIGNISTSSFLKGQNNRGWTIKFDWFVKPNNFVKVLEGNYEDKGGANTNGTNGSIESSTTFAGYELEIN